MDIPVIECRVSGRQRISLSRASLRRKRSMRAASKTSAAAVSTEKSKPRAKSSTVLQECVKTYFASLNSISRSIVLESEALQNLCPEWENLNAKQQEELLNKHFVPNSVVEHYSYDRCLSPFSDTEPEIDVTPKSSRSSAKKESIGTVNDEACISPKGKSAADITQVPAAVPRRKEKEPPIRAYMPNSSASALTSDDEEGVDTPMDRMDPVRRSFRVSSRQLADSRNRSVSMRVSRTRQPHYQAYRSQASNWKQTEPCVTSASPSQGNALPKASQPVKPRTCIKQPTQDTPQQVTPKQPIVNTPPNSVVPISRTSSACSSVSSISVPGFGGRVQKYSLQRQRHYSSQFAIPSSEHDNNTASPQLTRYSRRSEGAPRLHHISAQSLSNNNRSVHFEDEEHLSSLSQSCDMNSRKFVPVNQRWQENSAYSPRRPRANSQSPARTLDRNLSLRTARTRSQSPGRTLDESPQWSRGGSHSPRPYLDSSLSHLPTDTDYYADSDIASQRSITPESILEAENMSVIRPSDKKYVTGVQRSYSALKNRGGSMITTTTSSFANPRKNIRRSIPRKSQHKVSDAISEVGSNSFCTSQELFLSYSQSQDTSRSIGNN